MTTQKKKILEIRDLHTYYGSIHALKGIDLDVYEGELVTLIGSNGAGKEHHPGKHYRHCTGQQRDDPL